MVFGKGSSLTLGAMTVAATIVVSFSPAGPVAADTGCPTAAAPTQVGGVYEIDTVDKLQWAKDAGQMSNNYKLTANIDMTGCTWSNGIGSSATPYSGTFDGNSKNISNLTVEGGSRVGLFGVLSGSVSNLTLTSPSVSASNFSSSQFAGALAGELLASGSVSNVVLTNVSVLSNFQGGGGAFGNVAANATVSGVTVSGTVNVPEGYGGGVAGKSEGSSFAGLTSTVSVTGKNILGGLVGILSGGATVSNSSFSGTVTATDPTNAQKVGGAVGSASGTTPTCPTFTGVTTTGTLSGTFEVGGLIGSGSCYSIVRSSSSATVTASGALGRAGGLVGIDGSPGSVESSFFTGQVQATEVVGGLYGFSRSVISNSYSTGTVTATSATNGGRAGGLIGQMQNTSTAGYPSASVTNSYARGLVTPPSGSSSTTGGLIGKFDSGTVTSSVWDTETTGRTTSQGTGAKGYKSQQLKDYVLFDSDNLNWTITDGISSGDGVTTGTVWSICSGANSGYPFLTRQSLTGTCLPTMAYIGNGNTTGAAPSDPTTPYASGSTVTVLGNSGSMSRTAFLFDGWNTKADGTGTTYQPSNTFVITAPVMLFAKWTAAPTVTYSRGGFGSGSIATVTAATGSSVTLSSGSGFTRSGYTLSRWDTSMFGSGTPYALGETITMPAGGLALYAVWTQNTATTTTTTVVATTTTVPTAATTTTVTSATTTTTVASATTSTPAAVSTIPSSGVTTTSITAGSSSATGGQTASGTLSNALPAQTGRATTTTIAAPVTTTSVLAREIPDVEGVERGSAGATLGGREVTPEITEDAGSVIVKVGNATVRYTVVDAAGTRRSLTSAQAVALQPGDIVTVQLNGFAEDGEATSWLVPGDVALGSTQLLGGTGTITGTVPNDVTGGSRRIVTAAESRTGEPLVVAYGVDVNSNVSDGPSWSLVFLVIVGLAMAGGLLVPAARRGRDSETSKIG